MATCLRTDSHTINNINSLLKAFLLTEDIEITVANGCVNPSCGGDGDGHTVNTTTDDLHDCKKTIPCD